ALTSFAVTISVTTGSPSVMVPVLSNTIVSTFPVLSKASALLIKTPFSAPFPVPTMMAMGVAKPRAQGQAITNTEIAMVKAKVNDSPPIKYQPSPERTDKPITTGTNTPEISSANFAIGALDPWASSTN